MNNLGARVYGLAAIMMGISCFIWGKLATGWFPPPATLPGRTALAYLVGALLIAGGALVNWPRLTAWGAGLLTLVFATGLVLLDLTRLATHALDFGYWESSAEPVAIVAGGTIAFAASARMNAQLSSRIQRVACIVFGLCLFVFGTAHFVFSAFSATFVPSWLPPSQMSWVYFTGAAAIAAGLAILSGVLDVLAVRLLTLMYVIFGILAHVPRVLAHPADLGTWTENNVNLILIGVAWIVAESLARRRASQAKVSIPPLSSPAEHAP
jgi:uncharacterized membrane protein